LQIHGPIFSITVSSAEGGFDDEIRGNCPCLRGSYKYRLHHFGKT
jgi:hypothetical protein